VKDFDWVLMRGDRVAVMGPNGIGKSTLLKLALGTLKPSCGYIRQGTQWQLAYFDQMREQLDEERTVAQTISPGSEWVETAGRRQHVMGYLAEFLFSPRRANAPVRTLSGGERNRLLLARLFARPANVLVLDEPTNDLDLETLELLECTLQQYKGTVLLVSHDRAFIDAVATQTLVSRGQGLWREYPGGYSDWVAQDGQWPQTEARAQTQAQSQSQTQLEARAQTQAQSQSQVMIQTPVQGQTEDPPHAGPVLQPPDRMGPATSGMERQGGHGAPVARRKLSFREQRELEQMPARVAALEGEQQLLQRAMLEPGYFRSDAERLRNDRSRVDAIEAELLACLERWEALEAITEARTPS
jgi:ATP-binding cassette subfamily F protein uup